MAARRVGAQSDPEPIYGLSPEEAIALPTPRLAMVLLREGGDEICHWENWVGLRRQQSDLVPRSAAGLAWTEAWDWLCRQGILIADPTQHSSSFMQKSRFGRELASRLREGEDVLADVEARRLLSMVTRSELERARGYFIAGDFETAAFAATKAVEVVVRDQSGLPDETVGVSLMRQALGQGGPLDTRDEVAAERDARGHLFAGAIGLFKNPSSHRMVDFDDPMVAAEIVMLADLLLRLLERLPGAQLQP